MDRKKEVDTVFDQIKEYANGGSLQDLIQALIVFDEETLYVTFDITDVIGRALDIMPNLSTKECNEFFLNHWKGLSYSATESGHEYIEEQLREDFSDYPDQSGEDEEDSDFQRCNVCGVMMSDGDGPLCDGCKKEEGEDEEV